MLHSTARTNTFWNKAIGQIIDEHKELIRGYKVKQELIDLGDKTDSLKRLYAWQSIVEHRGNLAEEYLIWFVYYHTAIEIIGAFKANLRQYGDQIIEELQIDGLILVK